MKIDFTKDEIENLRDFIEFGFIDYIRNPDFEFDNVRYLFSMGNAFDKLEKAERALKESTQMSETKDFIQTMEEELGNE